jgi:hypothetical protein
VLACRRRIDTLFAVINADDFYGADSYTALATQLQTTPPHTTDFCMVGFRLGNTLSPNGPVCRGVCRVDADNRLVDIEEHTGLNPADLDGPTGLRHETPVSMNMWGFTPELFAPLAELFTTFRRQQAEAADAEFYLPAAVQRLVQDRAAVVRVLPSRSRWFGVTYPADRENAARVLQQLAADGTYPSPLFTDNAGNAAEGG